MAVRKWLRNEESCLYRDEMLELVECGFNCVDGEK
jgi:hypothetical protein